MLRYGGIYHITNPPMETRRLPGCERGTWQTPRTKLCDQPAQVQEPLHPVHEQAPGQDARISFLCLTYGAITHEKEMCQLTKRHHVYIHPKFPKLVQSTFRENIISDLVTDTEWGSIRLVDATVNLLRAALEADPASQWFVLLSQDVYPVVTEQELLAYLSKQYLSIFQVCGTSTNKASQWWIMNRVDAMLVVNKHEQFRPVFLSEKRRSEDGAPDELYFLSCLRHTRDVPHGKEDYQFTNRMSVYSRWLSHTIQKSPATFRRLTLSDYNYLRNLGVLFLRKTMDMYEPLPLPVHARVLVVVYVGTKSRQEYGSLCRLVDSGKVDVMVLSAIPVPQVNVELLKRCLCVHSIIWKFYAESVMDLTVSQSTYWERIMFLSETYSSDDLETCRFVGTELSPVGKKGLEIKYPLAFEPLYVHVFDRAKRPAYVFSNTVGRFEEGNLCIEY